MEYQAAIEKIYRTFGEASFRDRFLTRSRLADLVGSSLKDYRLIDLLFDLSALTEVALLFHEKGLSKAREELTHFYPLLEKKFTKREFVDAVNPIAAFVLPEEYEKAGHAKRKELSGAAVIVRAHPKKQNPTPLIVPKVQPQAKPAPKKKRKKAIRDIEILCNAGNLTLKVTKGNDVEVLVNGIRRNIDFISCTKGNRLTLPFLCAPGDDATVSLPIRNYNSLTLRLGNTNLTSVELLKEKNIHFNEISIRKKAGRVSFNAKAKKIEVLSLAGDVSLCGSYQEIDAKTKKGDLSFLLLNSGYPKITITATSEGKIDGRFFGDHLRPGIWNFFKKTYASDATCFVRNTAVYFDLKAQKGIRFV